MRRPFTALKRLLHTLPLLTAMLAGGSLQAGTHDPSFNPVDNGAFGNGSGFGNTVHTTVVQPDGKILVGGNFNTYNGEVSNYLARLNADGSLDTSFSASTNNIVHTIALQPDGKILIGGDFTDLNGILFNRIARLHSDGSIDHSFIVNVGFDNTVHALAVQADGKIVIGGTYLSFEGVVRNGIVRLNPDGSFDDTFQAGDGFNGTVRALAIQPDGQIIAAGGFISYNGVSRRYIARINPDGSPDADFVPGFISGGHIYSVVIQPDEKIIIAGNFNSVDGVTYNRIARLHNDASIDNSFDPGTGFDAIVYSLVAAADEKIVAVGSFTTLDGLTRNRIARLNTDGSIDNGFDVGTGPANLVYTVSADADGKLIIGGSFVNYDNKRKNRIHRLNADGSSDLTFNLFPGSNGTVLATLVQPDGKVLVAGNFETFNNVIVNRIARLNADGTLDETFESGTGFNDIVHTLVLQADGKILAGGAFTRYRNTLIPGLVRINPDGSLDDNFDPGDGFNSTVYAIALQADGKIVAGGSFTEFASMPINRIIRLNADGSRDMDFDPGTGFFRDVFALGIQQDGRIIVGGDFLSYNSFSKNYILRLYEDGSLDHNFGQFGSFDGNVRTLLILPDDRVLLGGEFRTFTGGMRTGRIAMLTANGALDNSFSFLHGDGFNGIVFSLGLTTDGKYVAGGMFTEFNTYPRNRIAQLHHDGSLDLSFDPGEGFDLQVNCLSIQPDQKIIAGGAFSRFDEVWKNGLIRLFPCNPSSATIQISACGSYTANGETFTQSGTYEQIIPSRFGCDSTITIQLHIDTINTMVTQSGHTLTAVQSGADYQWVNCDNGYAPIVGEQNQSFTATEDGNYAVIVHNGECLDTSACINVTVTGVEDHFSENPLFILAPNPNNGSFRIEASTTLYVEILDPIGRVVWSRSFDSGRHQIELGTAIAQGVWFISATDAAGKRSVQRMVVSQ